MACHRLSKNRYQKSASTSVRFLNRKLVPGIFMKKKYLVETAFKELYGNNLFIIGNLSADNRDIDDSCYYLKKKSVIKDAWSYNGVTNIKFNDE